jgi:parvulin-like peptidyl-prolyl isomerase
VTPESPQRARLLLLLGAGVGIAAAAAGLVSAPRRSPALPSGAVARVNDVLVRREDYDRTLAAAAQDRREPLDAVQRRRILDRLIEEELLVQRGLQLGLAESDRKLRGDLTMAVIDAVTEETNSTQPSEDELRRFYDQNLDFFSGPGRLRLRQVFVRVPSGAAPDPSLEKAQQALARLRAGESFDTVRAELGDREFAPIPDSLLPPAKLRDYVGPTALQAALALSPAEISEPVRSSMGYHVLQVLERQPDQAPPFVEIRPQVLGELRRRAGDQALRRYLDELRAHAEVVVSEDLP